MVSGRPTMIHLALYSSVILCSPSCCQCHQSWCLVIWTTWQHADHHQEGRCNGFTYSKETLVTDPTLLSFHCVNVIYAKLLAATLFKGRVTDQHSRSEFDGRRANISSMSGAVAIKYQTWNCLVMCSQPSNNSGTNHASCMIDKNEDMQFDS